MPDATAPTDPGDISVDEVTKVHGGDGTGVDNDAERLTILVVGDGFTLNELHRRRFNQAVDSIVEGLTLAEPFADADLAGAINVWKAVAVPVGEGVPKGWITEPPESQVPGEPLGPQDPPQVTPDDVPTLFGTAHPEVGNGMSWNRGLLSDWAAQIRPAFDVAIIVANSFRPGGTRSRNTAVVTLHGTGAVFLHELGHVLGLADEYDSGRDDRERPRWHHLLSNSPSNTILRYPHGMWRAAVGQPVQENVAYRSQRRATRVPWRDQLEKTYDDIDDAPVVPRKEDTCDERDNRFIWELTIAGDPMASVELDTFGSFEGAHLYRCRAWRSQFECMMRTAGYPFCVACTRILRRALLPYAPQ